MAKIKAAPPTKLMFKPDQMMAKGFWCVQVILPNGDETQIHDFPTKEEAEAWITNESASCSKGMRADDMSKLPKRPPIWTSGEPWEKNLKRG
jgi:hypothetical protein